MYELPNNITVLGTFIGVEPFNISGEPAWHCQFESLEEVSSVIDGAFAEPINLDFKPQPIDENKLLAEVCWDKDDRRFHGYVLVNLRLEPVGFYFEVFTGYMVFSLQGSHIPYPRFVRKDSSDSC
jgi:hypothetical protein